MYKRKNSSGFEKTTVSTPRITRTTAITTIKRKTSKESNDYKCRCQRNLHHTSIRDTSSSRSRSSRSTSFNERKAAWNQAANVSMQQLPQQLQTQNQHHQQHISSESAFMTNDPIMPNESNFSNGRCFSPESPLSTSSSLSSSEYSSTTTTTASAATNTTPSLGVNLRVTGQCSQGGRKYMEDYFSVAYQHSENAKDLEYAFFGIFDGHGGAEAATFAKEHLMMEIINQKLFWSDSDQDVLRAIREGYIATHFAMWREQGKWPKTANGLPSTAGTTATVAFIRHEKIYIGHVGDSGIVLGYQNNGEKWWRAKQLTTDHKPESVAERARIMRSGGKVVVKSGVPRVVWNRPRNAGHRGPIRHNTPIDEIPFLAVARSLGDLWSYNSLCNEFVVSPDPDVRVVKINPKTFRCLIFGTDGLWNVVTAQEAVNTVFHNEMINERLQRQRGGGTLSNENGWMNPSKVLVDRALGTWSAKKMRADNTSVVTVILHPPNKSVTESVTVNNVGGAAEKFDAGMGDNLGIEYTQVNPNYMHNINGGEGITYREMAQKYLPPEEYRNFNYYEDSASSNDDDNNANTSYYDDQDYAKLTNKSLSYFRPNTLESLEYMCENRKEMEQITGCNLRNISKNIIAEDTRRQTIEGIGIAKNNEVDNIYKGEECDLDDVISGGMNEEDVSNTETHENDMLDLNGYTPDYIRHDHQKDIILSENSFDINSDSVMDSVVDDTTTSRYMSTFTESYNTFLSNDNTINESSGGGHISSETTTSNSNSSYESHSESYIQQLVQEQHRYQQQCMSEEEGYSLTKLETRRDREQRCNATGMQTFRIFQQNQDEEQKADQQNNPESICDIQKFSNSHSGVNCEQNYLWEPRFPSAFSGTVQRYQNYQQQQQQFLLEQQLKSLELNSLLQQEREEEQQVELERQMELERFQRQQQQSLQSNSKSGLQTESTDCEKSSLPKSSGYLLLQGNDNASTELLAPTAISNEEETDSEITIHEEYLLLDEDTEANDASVQINEISSSCQSESDDRAPLESLQKITTDTINPKSLALSTTSLQLFTPLPSSSSSSSKEAIFTDAFESTSESSSYESSVDDFGEPPKIIEKLEKIEILHEKPELVIETARTSSIMETRSRQKLKTSIEIPPRRRCRSNLSTSKLHFPNIPKENQHQQRATKQQQAKSFHTSLKNNILKLTPVPGNISDADAESIYNKRQLRSTSSNGNGNKSSSVAIVSVSDNRKSTAGANGKSCFHTSSNSLNNSMDFVKRTLRTRNLLAKDLKAKTNLISSSIKRSASTTVTTRFLRTKTVNLINMHPIPQVLGSNCKKSSAATSSAAIITPVCTPRKISHQQQQRPLAAATLNFINLRSRQIGGNTDNSNDSNCSSNINRGGMSSQAASTASSTALLTRTPSKSLQIRNLAVSNNTASSISSTQNLVRRNLRSLSSVRSCIKSGKVMNVSTSTTGLKNYCKSMRSQSVTALVTPSPPSPKHLNPASGCNVNIAVTRTRTANTLPAINPSTAPPLLLSGTIAHHNNRKRTIRGTDSNAQDVKPIFIATRAQKRLRR